MNQIDKVLPTKEEVDNLLADKIIESGDLSNCPYYSNRSLRCGIGSCKYGYLIADGSCGVRGILRGEGC